MEKALSLLIKPASYLCNLSCAYCFYDDVSVKRGTGGFVMNDGTTQALVAQTARAKKSSVSICFQGGEPTLAGLKFYEKLLADFTKAMPTTTFCFSMQTNGIALNDEWIRFLEQHRFLVGLSIDGDEATHDAYRKTKAGGGSFRAVMAAVKLLQESNVPFNVLSVLTPMWTARASKIYGFFKQNNLRDLQLIPCIPNFEKEETSEFGLTNQAYLAIMKQLFDCWYNDYQKADYVSVRHIDSHISALAGVTSNDCGAGGGCGGYFAVESDGSVYPCDFYCTNEYLLGNLNSQNFSFNAQTQAQERFMAEGALPSVCKACRHVKVCQGGCRRNREPNLQQLRTCEENKKYFDYTLPRMLKIAETVQKRLRLT